jgi:hypothetical protein
MIEDTTYSKKSTGASPYFGGGQTPPKGIYMENPGRVNTPRDIPAGGEVRPGDLRERAGSLGRPSLTGDSPVRR